MFTKSEKHNINYLASIIKLSNVRKLPNSDRLQCVTVQGNNVITGLTAKDDDLYCFFPLESSICEKFLAFSNSYREPERNSDKKSKGFFEYHGRVRALRLRGEKSEGYMVPVSELERFAKEVLGKSVTINEKSVGESFDTFFGEVLCKKYIPRGTISQQSSSKKTKGNVKRYISKLVENQFRFHEDTSHLKREVHKISPDDSIAITEKLHGCNFIVSNVLIKRKLSFRDRLAKYFGVKVDETEYGMLYSSRAVIKNSVMDDGKVNNNFYDADVWKIVADQIFPSLDAGISVVGEIVGYTPSGKAIQKNYDYGCESGKLDFWIFKVTYTNPKGNVYVFNHEQTVNFCCKFGFKMPKTHYAGKAKDLFPELVVDDEWHNKFLEKMMSTYLEKKCSLCVNDVWAEGVILRKDVPHEWDVFKLKSFNFLMHESAELDAGIVDMETAETAENE